MESYEWVSKNKFRWSLSILRFAYFLTGILSILLFLTPFYIWFMYLWPHAAQIVSGSMSIYLALVAIAYGVTFMIVTAALVILHGLGEKYLTKDSPPDSSL